MHIPCQNQQKHSVFNDNLMILLRRKLEFPRVVSGSSTEAPVWPTANAMNAVYPWEDRSL